MMLSMFWRLVTSRWVALLGLCLALLGIPGMLQDAAIWFGWFGKLPRSASIAAISVGSLLVMAYVFTNRERIKDSTLKLLAATRAGYIAFRWQLGPTIRAAVWSDLDSGQPSVESNQWEIIKHTVRRTGLVAGEAYPVLVGMAKVKELRGERYLYMCVFLHAGGSHMELRIEAHDDPIVRRHAVVKVDGEILSEMTFDPCLTPVVSDTRRRHCIREEAAHLLDVGEVLSLSVTDTVTSSSRGQREHRHDVLRVPLRGYRPANARLSGIATSIWSISLHGYSPPEFVPALDPHLIDDAMKLITDPASYDEWRTSMSGRFGIEGDDNNTPGQIE